MWLVSPPFQASCHGLCGLFAAGLTVFDLEEMVQAAGG
jgi:hypothetical protein